MAGAKAADPKVKELNAYSQNFIDQAKCKEIALNQIAQGSDVVFQVAGGCGLGALDAAKEKGVWGIGVDADQAYLGPSILTSAIKKVDVGRVRHDQGGPGRHVQGRRRTVLRHRERRRRHRQDQLEGAAGDRATGQDDRARRSSPARSRTSRTRSSRHVRRGRVPARPGYDPAAWTTRPSSSCAGSPSASPGSSRTTTSTSTCAGRGARAARRERRRQVDADERPLRPLPADEGEIWLKREAGRVPLARRTRSRPGSGWCTSTSC